MGDIWSILNSHRHLSLNMFWILIYKSCASPMVIWIINIINSYQCYMDNARIPYNVLLIARVNPPKLYRTYCLSNIRIKQPELIYPSSLTYNSYFHDILWKTSHSHQVKTSHKFHLVLCIVSIISITSSCHHNSIPDHRKLDHNLWHFFSFNLFSLSKYIS